MRRLASSIFHKKDKSSNAQDKSTTSKDAKLRPLSSETPSDASSHQSYPSSLAPTASSSATSISVRTPLERGQAPSSPAPPNSWKAMFRGRKNRKGNEEIPRIYTGDEPRISKSRLYSAHYADSFEELNSPTKNDHVEEAYLSPPVRPFLHTSTRSNSSSPNSSRSSLSPPSAYTNLQAITISKINQNQFTIIHPLLYLPNTDSLFPRSSNFPESLSSPPPTLSIQLFRTQILKRLEARNLSPSEEESIRPFVSRPRIKPKLQVNKQPVDDEAVINQVSGSNDWSRGLNRWANRPCFEERNVVWVRSVGGGLVSTPVTGRPIAALEYSEGLEALAGLREHTILPQSLRPNRSSLYLDLPSLGRSSPSPAPSIGPVTPTSPYSPLPSIMSSNKRAVRFSQAQSSQKLAPRPTRDIRDLDRERREAERERVEQERLIERQRKQMLQEEVAAARLRRESFKLYGGSTSIRALADLAAKDDDLSPPHMPHARRTATDPGPRSFDSRSNTSSSPRTSSFLDVDMSGTSGRPRSRLSVSNLQAQSANSLAMHHRLGPTATSRDSANGSVRSLDTRPRKPRVSSSSNTHTDDARSIRSLPHSSHSYGPSYGPSPYFQYPVPPMPMMPNPNFYPPVYGLPLPPPMLWGNTLPGSPGHRPIGIPDNRRRSSNPTMGPVPPRPPSLGVRGTEGSNVYEASSQSRSLPQHRSSGRSVLT